MYAHISNQYLSDATRGSLLALLTIVFAAVFAAMPTQAQEDGDCNEDGGHAKYSITVVGIASDRITLVSSNINTNTITRGDVHIDAPGPLSFRQCGEIDVFNSNTVL